MCARRQAAEVRNVCLVERRQMQGKHCGGEQQETGGQCERNHHEPEHACQHSDLQDDLGAKQ